MKTHELVRYWQENAQGRSTATPYQSHLDLEAVARLAAWQEMYPKHHVTELLGAALNKRVIKLPCFKGSKVVTIGELSNPLYEERDSTIKKWNIT